MHRNTVRPLGNLHLVKQHMHGRVTFGSWSSLFLPWVCLVGDAVNGVFKPGTRTSSGGPSKSPPINVPKLFFLPKILGNGWLVERPCWRGESPVRFGDTGPGPEKLSGCCG